MYCSKCGKERKENSNCCYNCGNEFEKAKAIKKEVSSGNEETSLVLGIICLLSSFIVNILCFIPGIISIVYARKYKKESGKLGVGFGLSIGGMVFSVVILVFFLLFVMLIINAVDVSSDSYKDDYYTEYTYNIPYM